MNDGDLKKIANLLDKKLAAYEKRLIEDIGKLSICVFQENLREGSLLQLKNQIGTIRYF